MADHEHPLLRGTQQHMVSTSEQELVRVGGAFAAAFSARVEAGEAPLVVLAAMAYALGVHFAMVSAVPHLSERLDTALPTFALGYRSACRVAGEH